MRKKSSLKKKKGKKTYKIKKSKLNKPLFKNKSVQQKGGNLDIILPATALTLTAAAVGGVYISKNISGKKYNKQNIVNNKTNLSITQKKDERASKTSNTSKTTNARNTSNTRNISKTTNARNTSITSQENRQDNFIEICSDMNDKKCKESKIINNKLIINLMLGKIEDSMKKKNFSIESVLLEPKQTIDKTYRSLLDLATDKHRTVSSYVNKYINQLFHAYFLFELSENNKITFSEAFTEDLKNYFSEQLQTIRKTALDKDKQNIGIPGTDNIESLFDAAKAEIKMIMSVIKELKNKINENDKENIEKSAPEYIKEIGNGELPDLKSPQNFYTKLINRHYEYDLLNR